MMEPLIFGLLAVAVTWGFFWYDYSIRFYVCCPVCGTRRDLVKKAEIARILDGSAQKYGLNCRFTTEHWNGRQERWVLKDHGCSVSLDAVYFAHPFVKKTMAAIESNALHNEMTRTLLNELLAERAALLEQTDQGVRQLTEKIERSPRPPKGARSGVMKI